MKNEFRTKLICHLLQMPCNSGIIKLVDDVSDIRKFLIQSRKKNHKKYMRAQFFYN